MKNRKTTHRRRVAEKGSALLESALVVIVFLTALIAALDLGIYLFINESLAERVRNALRYGAVNTFDAATIQNIVLYGQTAEPSGQPAAFNLERSMVNVTRMDAGSTEDRIVLTVTYRPLQVFSPALGGSLPSMKISQTAPYEMP